LLDVNDAPPRTDDLTCLDDQDPLGATVYAAKKRHCFGLQSAVTVSRELRVGQEPDVTNFATNQPEERNLTGHWGEP
jgi:hypothetical protein